MERAMFGISLRDKIRNEEIRRRAKVVDRIEPSLSGNGHVARHSGDRWVSKLVH